MQGDFDINLLEIGPDPRPYFEKIDMTITVYTDEPSDRLEKLKKNVEFRCPVMNLMRAADVELNVTWQAEPAATFAG